MVLSPPEKENLEQKCTSWINRSPDFKSGVACLAEVGLSYALFQASMYCNTDQSCRDYVPSLITGAGSVGGFVLGLFSAIGVPLSFLEGNRQRKIRNKLMKEGLDEHSMSANDRAKEWIKQNCEYTQDYYHPDVPVIEYGFPKTRAALKSLAQSDPRTNEELIAFTQRSFDSYYHGCYSHTLATAILTERLSSEKTLQDCLLEANLVGRTFRSYDSHLNSYQVIGIPIHWHRGFQVEITIKSGDREYNSNLVSHLNDRLVK